MKKGGGGASKKTQNAPPKSMPHPADLRPLENYGGMIMEYVRREHRARFKRLHLMRRGG